jgi:hypothetical protein
LPWGALRVTRASFRSVVAACRAFFLFCAEIVSNEEKRQLEAANFETFLFLGKIRFDRYELQAPPEPDVIAWRGEHQFGIEITNFHNRHAKRKEGEEDSILEAALCAYKRSNGPELLLHVIWSHQFVPRKRDRRQIAEKIALLALCHRPTTNEWVTIDWRSFDETLLSAIDNISMHRMPAGRRAHWSAARGGFVPAWDVEQLQREINRKKGKPKQYRKQYCEKWLLIVSPFGTPSSWMELNEEVRAASFVSLFDKIFLLSSFPHEVVELHATTHENEIQRF